MKKAVAIKDSQQLALIEPFVSRTALKIPASTSYDDWLKLGKPLGLTGAALRWWIGDWLNFGIEHFKDHAIQAADMLGLDEGTVANIQKVCAGVKAAQRTELSFEHHKEVYLFDPFIQEKWLGKAVQNHWTRADLRGAIKDAELRKKGRTKVKAVAASKRAKKNGQQAMPTVDLYEAMHKELGAVFLLIPPLAELGSSIKEKWSERMPNQRELAALEKLLDEGRAKFYDLLAVVRELLGLEEAAA